jgi:Tfp pilus assembly protein PilZ
VSISEQRGKARHPHESKLSDEDLVKGVQLGSKMFNYSETGLYFESDMELQAGEKIFIGIEDSPYADERDVYECYHAMIKWRKNLTASEYKYGYGIQFYDPEHPPSSQVYSGDMSDALPAERDVEISKDLRRHPRKEISKNVDCFVENRQFKGHITDIGPSGAFIETDETFEVGQKFKLSLPFLKNNTRDLVKAKVIRISERGIGVKFIKTKK